MVNEDYNQIIRNNDRGTYLKGANQRKNDPNPEEISGPVLQEQNRNNKKQ